MAGPIRRFWRSLKKGITGFFVGFGGQGGHGLRLLLPGSHYDYEAQAGDLWRNSAVAAILGWIRTNFPEPILYVARRDAKGDLTPVADQRVARLIARPNPFYDGFALWAVTSLSYNVDGNAYWLKVRAGTGEVVQLWWLPHWLVEPRWTRGGNTYITHYTLNVNGRDIPIPISEIVHFRDGLDPRNDRKGMAPLKSAVREVCADNDGSAYTSGILRNMGTPGVIIAPEGGMDAVINPDDGEEIARYWRENFTGDNRGAPLVLSSPMKVTQAAMSPEKIRLDRIVNMPEARVCAALRVDAQVVGLLSGSMSRKYANMIEARKAAYEDNIVPSQRCMASTLTLQLLQADFSTDEAEEMAWDYKHIICLRESQDLLMARASDGYQKGVLKRSEARGIVGLDSGPEDDVYFIEPGANKTGEPDAGGDEGESDDGSKAA